MSRNVLSPITVPAGMDPQGYPEYLWWCPGCCCAHYVNVTRGRVRWQWNGNLEKPTINPSLLVQRDEFVPPVTSENMEEFRAKPWPQTKVRHVCHTFIRDGKIQFLSDCTHKLRGQTVDMEPINE